MPKIQFIGKVLPTGTIVSAGLTLPDINRKWEAQNLTLTFRVKINNSIVNVECESERYEADYASELYKNALDLVNAVANVMSFTSSVGLRVILEAMIGPDGVPRAIILDDPTLQPLCTAYSLDSDRAPDLQFVYKLAVVEFPLSRALNDLIDSITFPHVIPVNCGRAIESIRRLITPNADVNRAWRAMQNALNISQEYQEWISKHAIGPRHGDTTAIRQDITREIRRRAWAIMNRYLEYRKRNSTPLTAPEFPPLVSPPEP